MGGGLPRKEDPNLVTGKANWTDNIKLPGMLHMTMLRSPFARAKVTHLDVSSALEQTGVVAVFTGEDLADEWPGGVPCGAVVSRATEHPLLPTYRHGRGALRRRRVAVVVANNRYAAQTPWSLSRWTTSPSSLS
jgi:carbon-monoxide dehydrogenase large subunit